MRIWWKKKLGDFMKKFYNHSKALQKWFTIYENLLLFIVYFLRYI
jgi:mRNA-degrading endonuclease HigB of HigAB toxin-antitoxin module